MVEALQQTPEGQLSQQMAQEWFRHAEDRITFADQAFSYGVDRGNGPETVEVSDFVVKRTEDGRKPVAYIITPEGTLSEVEVYDLLHKWRGMSDQDVVDELATFKAEDERAEAVSRELEDKQRAAAEELRLRWEKENEARTLEHYKWRFRPYHNSSSTLTENMPTDGDYSDLFDPDIEMSSRSTEEAAVRHREQPVDLMTEQSEKDAIEEVNKVVLNDSGLNEIILSYRREHNLNPEDIPKALRTDADFRLAVGMHFIRKIEANMDKMPGRVMAGGGKSPHAPGYPTMPSNEYAALLALSMLDGTFNNERQVGDPIAETTNSSGGHHRYAARLLLSHI